MSALEIGQTISHYKILEKIGEGGMGVVYKAQDIKLNRLVSLKFLSQQLTSDDEAVKRFINEAQTASSLDHANICTIYEIDQTEGGQWFIAMAFYEGETLRQKMRRGLLSIDDAIDIAIQTGHGLTRAHEAGIIHRDIKPENLIVTKRGEVKIIDFGIAKLVGQRGLTQTRTTVGTVAYMSPEQTQAEEVDHRTDIWSLGITLYEMLTGKLPFQGDYEAAVIYSILNEPVPELRSYRSDLSPNLQLILNRALEKNPDERYQSVREMIADLQALSDTDLTSYPQEVKAAKVPEIGYLPDYENDIFVSYAHIDDKPLTPSQKGWITIFHQALEIRLAQLLGSETRIWRDEKMNSKATPFPNVAIMLSIVSPQYVKSTKCIQEVKEFYQIAERGEGLWVHNRARIFKAVKTYVPRESQPEELQSIPEYEFFQFDPVTGRPKEFWPELGTEANRNFWAKLEDIAYDIFQLMETLKKKKTESEQKGGPSFQTTLYLAETTYDLMMHRDKIKRQLQQRGYTILPDRPLPLNVDDLQKQIQTYLERSTLSIHLVGENYGVVPEGETRSLPEIQHELALKRGQEKAFPRLIWLPPYLKVQDKRQQSFIESLKKDPSAQKGAHILQTSLEEFKTFMIDKLSEKPEESKERVAEDHILRIYLQCDQRDLDATSPLETYLFEQGFEIRLPAFEGDELEVFEAHKENLLLCDATIIYYGQATDSWLSTKLADLQKVAGYGRTEPMKVKAVYLAAPLTKFKERFRTREALMIKHFDDFSPKALEPFLGALKNGHGVRR